MSDQFQSIQSGAGLLKDNYDDDKNPISAALRRRSERLRDKVKSEQQDPKED